MSVTKFGESLHALLVPLRRSCLRSSMPLSGAEKDIKIRWSESNILCSQTADARKSSCLLPGCHHVLLILHLFSMLPATSPVGEQCCVTCGWAGQPLQIFCSCSPRPDHLPVLKVPPLVVWLLLHTRQYQET